MGWTNYAHSAAQAASTARRPLSATTPKKGTAVPPFRTNPAGHPLHLAGDKDVFNDGSAYHDRRGTGDASRFDRSVRGARPTIAAARGSLPMYVDKVRLRDVRAVASATVTLTHPTAEVAANLELPNFNLVLGTYCSGKSSVLAAIAAALTSDGYGENLPDSTRTWPMIGDDDALIQLRIASSDADDIESDICLEIGPGGLSPQVRWFRVHGTISYEQFVAADGPVRRTDARSDFYDLPGRLHMLVDDTPGSAAGIGGRTTNLGDLRMAITKQCRTEVHKQGLATACCNSCRADALSSRAPSGRRMECL